MSPPAMSAAPGGGPVCVLCPVMPRGCGVTPAALPARLLRCLCPAPGQGEPAPAPASPGPLSPSPGHRQRWPHLPARIPFSPPPAEPRATSILLFGCCASAGGPTGAASNCTTAERRHSLPARPVLGRGAGSSPEGSWGAEPATVLTPIPCARWQRAHYPTGLPQAGGGLESPSPGTPGGETQRGT